MKKKYDGTKYFIDGVPLKKYCEMHDIKYYSVINRINLYKDSLENSIKRLLDLKNKCDHYCNIKHFIDGVPAIHIATSNGIHKELFYNRLKKGWDVKRACTYKHLTIKELAIKLNVSVNKIRCMRENGCTWEELEDIANGRKI